MLLLALTSASPALADERTEAREHYYKGTKAFELGLYDEAIGEYMAAYKAKDNPALLYNIAQSHRLAGHAAEALRFYKVYLVKLPRSANRDEVENKIAELEKLVEQQKKATQQLPPDKVEPLGQNPPAAPTEPPHAEPAAPAPAATEAATPAAAEITPAPIDLHPGRTKKIAGLAVAGVGLAALAAGIALEVLAGQASQSLTNLDHTGGIYDPGKQSAGQTDDVAGGVLLGIGGAAAVAGVIVAALGFRDAKRARAVSLRPVVSPMYAGAVMGVMF